MPGIEDDIRGEVPCGFIVLKTGVIRPPEEIEKEISRPGPREDRSGGSV